MVTSCGRLILSLSPTSSRGVDRMAASARELDDNAKKHDSCENWLIRVIDHVVVTIGEGDGF